MAMDPYILEKFYKCRGFPTKLVDGQGSIKIREGFMSPKDITDHRWPMTEDRHNLARVSILPRENANHRWSMISNRQV
jgi:hypothetical protein